MACLTAEDFPQMLLELYDHYAHGLLNKREFLSLAAKYAIGGLTAASLSAQPQLCAGAAGGVHRSRHSH